MSNKKHTEGTIILVKVIPNASKNEIVGWESGELKVRITAVPDKGKANDMLISFLAKCWGIKRSQITILQGQTSRHKKLLIEAAKGSSFPQTIEAP